MADAPRYVSQQNLGGGEGNLISVPQIQGSTAMTALGGAMDEFAQKLEKARDEAAVLNGQANFYQQANALKIQYQSDADPATAPQRFQADLQKLQGNTLTNAGVGGVAAARLRLHLVEKGITDYNEVFSHSLGRQKDGAEANLETISTGALTDAATATTPLQRQAAIDRFHGAVDGAANSLLISQEHAALKKLSFDHNLDNADAMRAIQANPEAAGVALTDPKQFPTLTPVQRETYAEHARNAVDKRGVETAVAAGAAFPAAASMIAGRMVRPGDTDQIFDKVILGLESDGKNLPPNAKGAFGPAQLIPGTARDMAKLVGRDDLAALNDKDLTDALMKDPGLNQRLGLTYWHQLERRYDGNVPLMMAAYNAGPGNADKWKAAAERQFGPDFTAAQLSSVIPFKETQDYLARGHAIGGARMDAFGVSPAGRYEMGVKLGSELVQDQARQNHIIDQLAAVAMADDPVIGMLKQGVDVDPGRLSQTRAALVDAAATGSVENIKRLRDFDFMVSIQPKVAQAYRMPFAALDAAVNLETARVNAPGANPSWRETQQLQVLQTVREHIQKARDENPTGLLARAGIAPAVQVDTAADPASPDFRAALGARGAQAVTAQKLYGGSAVALSPAEADSMKERWKQAGGAERFGILKAMADTLPAASYMDTAKKITGNEDAGVFTARLLVSRPALAREFLDGEELMKTKDIGEKADLARSALADTVGGQIFPDARQQGAAVNAAIKIDVARRAAAGTLYDRADMSGVSKAFQDITGEVVKRNGITTVAPPSVPSGDFTGALDALDDHALTLHGGAFDGSGKPISAHDIGHYGKLRPLTVGGDQYVVTLPSADGQDRPVMTASEIPRPLVLDMRRVVTDYRAKNLADHSAALREAAKFAGPTGPM